MLFLVPFPLPPKYLRTLSAFFSKQYLDTIGPFSHASSHIISLAEEDSRVNTQTLYLKGWTILIMHS